ncbi:sigma-70 family RNA polymerase sigma factor [Actinoallomurus purpureus]|uniref:sigma-70 family RNA polymerase sigma factor n=1 Tax=Actinoallomurus purpureus TaxID=478114 RepID=UPI0020929BD4|nr:sigma-70 family RNA polymerase sigma factor [Actinoallomurus purpureus]MCO6007042.1 sigma-70 family RNA polymerase sigma factor [Actinoallomurus purpureus]
MAGWPIIDRADDQRLAQALRAGHTSAMAELYDAYAARLYDYCHVLLRDQDLAAQGLTDSLIIVQERITGLPDPRLFRGWLYAVTRAECLRRRAESGIPEDRQKAREAEGLVETDESTRRLVHAALMALGGQQREILDLTLRHELDPHELAEVLSTTPQKASVLIEQARNDLDDAFAAVVVAATGRDDCPSIPALAGPVGRPLDAETCGRLARHIGNCPICGLRANRKVATARLLHAMPIAAVPADLRERVMGTATAPQYADMRATIAMRSDPPRRAADHDPEDEPRRKAGVWVAVGAAAFGVMFLAGILLLLPGSGGKENSGNQAIAAPPSGSPSDDPSESSPAGATPTKTKTSHTPTPTPTPGKSKTPKPKHTKPATTGPAPTTPGSPPSSAPGTLAVSGCDMRYSSHCKVTVTAQGGPVNWAVARTSGAMRASGSGDLGTGESAYVTVSRTYAGICIGSGSGTVSFTSGASADVRWSC